MLTELDYCGGKIGLIHLTRNIALLKMNIDNVVVFFSIIVCFVCYA